VENPLQLAPFTKYELDYDTAIHTSGSNQNDGIATEINSKIEISTGRNPCELQLEIKSSSFVADGLVNPLR